MSRRIPNCQNWNRLQLFVVVFSTEPVSDRRSYLRQARPGDGDEHVDDDVRHAAVRGKLRVQQFQVQHGRQEQHDAGRQLPPRLGRQQVYHRAEDVGDADGVEDVPAQHHPSPSQHDAVDDGRILSMVSRWNVQYVEISVMILLLIIL